MSCSVLSKLIGKQINGSMIGPDGKPAKILFAVSVRGFTTDEEGRVKLTICYAKDKDDELIAYLGRHPAEGAANERRGHWKIKDIENLNQQGLVGFISYAKHLGITPAQLVHNITRHKPSI